MTRRRVFITGGTGYMGRALIGELVARGHEVRALVRRGSEGKLRAGVEAVVGDPLDESSFAASVAPSDPFVQLGGVPRPRLRRRGSFERLISCRGALRSMRRAAQE